MKKITGLILSAVMILNTAPITFAGYTDVTQAESYCQSALRLQDLGILNGYSDGSFGGANRITRAEFTKIVVCMMDKEKEAVAQGSSSGFYDIPVGSWFSPYINFAVARDILSGYSDGSFGPDKTISYAEAVTILMRTLGYTENEVGYYWPNNYLNAASSLGLTRDMYYDVSTPLTRSDAAVLTDRALFTKPSSAANPQQDTYLETIGCSVLDDALILDADDKSNNITVLSGNLKLNNAATYISKTQTPLTAGDIYEYAVINKDGYLTAVKSYDGEGEIASLVASVNKLTENTIEYTAANGIKGTYKADDSFVIYSGNSKMSFAQAKNLIANGADITFYGTGYGLWNIAVIGTGNDIDPTLASSDFTSSTAYLGYTPINKTNLTVYRNGEAAVLSDIKAGDVIYYNTKTNIMDVYSKKVTGIYYSAYPSKAYVESITVGGKSYEIGYSAATNKLDASSGAFEIGDKITLLLGKNDKIAYVTDNSSSFDYFEYGVLLSCSTRTATEGANEGNSEYIANMFMADGTVHEIVVNKLYKDNAGDFMRISYSNGVASLTKQSATKSDKYTGKIDSDNRTINGKYLLKDAAIIQRISDDSANTAECELLDFDNLTASQINSTQIINVITANSFGDIAIMYVKDLENTYTYGVVTGFSNVSYQTEDGSSAKQTTGYKIFANGVQGEYSLGNLSRITTAVGEGVGIRQSGGVLTKIISLNKLAQATVIGAVEGSRIMLNDKIYKMAPDVQIIDITDVTKPKILSIDDLAQKNNISSAAIYSDKSASNNASVRVVTVKLK